MGVEPITQSELMAFQFNYGLSLEAWEVDALFDLDLVFRNLWIKEKTDSG